MKKIALLLSLLIIFNQAPCWGASTTTHTSTYPARTLTYQDVGLYEARRYHHDVGEDDYGYVYLYNVGANSVSFFLRATASTSGGGSTGGRASVALGSQAYEISSYSYKTDSQAYPYSADVYSNEIFTFNSLQPGTVYTFSLNGAVSINVVTKTLIEEAATNATYSAAYTAATNTTAAVTAANSAATNASAAATAATAANTQATSIKTDTTTLKTDTTALKTDTSTIKADTGTLKTDTTALKTDTAVIKSKIDNLDLDVSQLQADMTAITGSVTDISEIINQDTDTAPPRILNFQAKNGVSVSDKNVKDFEVAVVDNSGVVFVRLEVKDLVTGQTKYIFPDVANNAQTGDASNYGILGVSNVISDIPLFEGENRVILVAKDMAGQEVTGEWRIKYKDSVLAAEIPDMLSVDPDDAVKVTEFFEQAAMTTPSASSVDFITSPMDGLPAVSTSDNSILIQFAKSGNPPFYKYSFDGVDYSEPSPIENAFEINTKEQGLFKVYVKSIDANMVEGVPKTYRFLKDSVGPEGTVILGEEGQSVSRVGANKLKVVITATDNITAHSQIEYRINGGQWAQLGDGVAYADVEAGKNKYTVELRDLMGNVREINLNRTVWGI